MPKPEIICSKCGKPVKGVYDAEAEILCEVCYLEAVREWNKIKEQTRKGNLNESLSTS